MINSMTGYGKAESQTSIENKKLVVEIRSLNSKSLDLNVRIAPLLRSKELEIRTLIAQRLERGKIDLSIYYQDTIQGDSKASYTPINREAFIYYYKELIELQKELGWANNQNIVASVLRMPDVTKVQESTDICEDDWKIVLETIDCAITEFNAFRNQEGLALYAMFCEKLDAITSLLAEVENYEQGRVDKIRTRLETNLEQLSANTQQVIDRNRLEQEMIFYLEKLDITEEKVRLTNHLRYFRETMECEGAGVGKKLGFIAQEMGREINTLGSKSNQSEMQIIVVKMKDILEQIKEQVLNVL
jgi:uncharacterized protein (TIGR00255 family)